jgi:radical SAM superfamily enzyme YgiQ (UPF0313 family)
MGVGHHLAPDIDSLPFVGRRFLTDDPYRASDGRIEANMVGARGCPYDCSFCGAAVSANPEITISTRTPENLIEEMHELDARYGVSAFRFVDDLFLGYERFIRKCMTAFTEARIGDRYVWDATGRINILHRMSDELLDVLQRNGCREVALGIESGSERLLKYMGKRITPEMTRSASPPRPATSWTPPCARSTTCGASRRPSRADSGPASSSSVPTPARRNGTGSSPPAATSHSSSWTTPPST